MPSYTSEELQKMQADGKSQTNWKQFDAIDDTCIDDNDALWDKATVIFPHRKKQVTLRIDEDLLEWYRKEAVSLQGKGYQTMMHTVLASYRSARTEQDKV